MPINAYTGLMGSGKSFECVRSVIVPAIAKGRRVVTNVEGIDSEAIRAFVHERQAIALEKLGHVVHCKNEDVFSEAFFPFGEPAETVCRSGDLICIDEAWRFWGTDSKICKNHRIFFREHRHYVDEATKVSCDLVLMVQDIGDLHRILKAVVELSFRTTKIKSLGLSKVYRVEMWEGWRQTQRARIAVENKKYDPEVFPLYQSYSGGSGKELTVDDRQNVLKSPKLWLMGAGVIACAAMSAYGVAHFFGKKRAPTPVEQSQRGKVIDGPTLLPQVAMDRPKLSEDWRAVGRMSTRTGPVVVLVNAAGDLRVEHPSAFKFDGGAIVGDVDGARVTAYSGKARASPPSPAAAASPMEQLK